VVTVNPVQRGARRITPPEGESLLGYLPQALAGDAGATRALLNAVAPDVARVARAVLGQGAEELDDVTQEALLGLLHALPSFRGDCGLRRFANRIAVRTALHARRRRGRRGERLAEFALIGEPESGRERPDEQWRVERRRSLLMQLLDELPEPQAETLALRVVLGFSLDETAAATGVAVNTVRSRVRLAREALRARIEANRTLRELFEVEP
jgi:RNA polymerase sigma-70 factor (ECF subfamily)